MAVKLFSKRNLDFLLYEVFDAESVTGHEYYGDYNKKMLDMVIQAATELAEGLLLPNYQEMDQIPPELADDQVRVHPSVRAMMKAFGEGGWIGDTFPENQGGQQLPHLVSAICRFIFAAANFSASAFGGLTTGAAHLILSFGGEGLYETYVPKMLAGAWQGTMALTEPEAGSSMADLTTTAEPTDGDYYHISGQKIFISAGDHDAVENIVHLLLARIKGAPPGVKGISLFVVPKFRVEDDGRLVPNDVVASGIFHKLGYRGCPAIQLSLGDRGDCRGYLVGKPNQGLMYMFQMMNEARIGVGMGATALASAAYYAALDYAQKRHQGRMPGDKDPTKPPVPIIEHPDVKRMLLFQRACVEGALSLLLQCSRYVDMQKVSGDEDKGKYGLLLEILTPVAKTYPSENGVLSISNALQCFGGSGYCDDYPLEQYYRDARIHPIHEGTTGIHGLDLLGRKVVMKDGVAFLCFLKEVQEGIALSREFPELLGFSQKLEQALERLKRVTSRLVGVAGEKGPEYGLGDASLYLELFGIITIAWQWLLQGTAVHKALRGGCNALDMRFYQGKLHALRYFFSYELPKIAGLEERLMDDDFVAVQTNADLFQD